MLKKFVPIVALLLLAACSSLGIPQADTFNKKVIVANSLVESVVSTVDTLYTANKISRDEALKARDTALDARAAIEATRLVYKTNPADAENRLDAISSALTVLISVLESKQ